MATMKKIIIFDFNRTLYDPERKKLLKDTFEVLAFLKRRNYTLVLISTAKHSRRELIGELGIASYFDEIVITTEKKLHDFKNIVDQIKPDRKNSFVIGDRVRQEILYGNKISLKTIWIKQGKFADELPVTADEQPDITVEKLGDVLKIIAP